MTDWNPNDPDATQVHYDMTAWDFDQQAELAAAMADAEIPHAWDGNELIVPEEMEQAADELIERIEAVLGIVSDQGDQGGAGDAGDVFEGDDRPAPIALADGEPTTEYDLVDWSVTEIDTVSIALAGAGIPFRWEGQVLLVGTADEEVAEALLDDIESGEYVDVGGANPPAADEVSAEVLTTFFLAAERLRRDPRDPDGLDHLRRATDVADLDVAPFGITPKLWHRTVELAEELVDALVEGDEPDHDAAMDSAAQLHELLRPHV